MSFLEAVADAIQAPLFSVACLLSPSAFSLGFGVPPSFSASAVIPADCGRPPAPEFGPMLSGQCPTLYNVRVNVYRPDGTTFGPIDFSNVVGPIRSIGGEWVVDFFNNTRYRVVVVCPNDTEPPTPGFRKFGPFTSYTDPDRASRTILVSANRVDGLPDNCGPSTGQEPPPQPPTTTNIGPINVTFGGNTYNLGSPQVTFYAPVNIPIYGGIHIPVTVNFPPSVGFPVGINLPVYLSLPGLQINPKISFFNFDLSTEIKNITTINTFPQVGGGGGGLPTVRRIIGLRVVSTIGDGAPVTVINGGPASPNLYVPRLATVRFIPPSGFPQNVSVDQDVKSQNQYIPVPWFYGADDYRVLANVGVTCNATPVYANIADLVQPD